MRHPGIGKRCYELREWGLLWREVAEEIREGYKKRYAQNMAKAYALAHNKIWPIRTGEWHKNREGMEFTKKQRYGY